MKKIFICIMACMLAGCSYGRATVSTESVAETSAAVQESFAPTVSEAVITPESVTTAEPETVITPEPVKASENTDGKQIFDTLSSEKKTKLNVFFSNFAEAYFDEYDCDNISANELISFAFIHNRINGTSEEEYDMFTSSYFEYVMGIRSEVMDKLIDRYFGVSVPHEETVSRNEYGRYEGWAFKDGYVYTEAASGEFYDYCAIATSLTDLGDGTYTAEYDKYCTDLDMMDKKYYSYTPKQAQSDSELKYCGSYAAVIKPAVVDGKDTWQLLKLKEI